ncbi:hypothetical protein NPIL_290171 [Nephila pilipes]|uniref:Uncharacterized protein n=1 Tax=Nephila pilipes TaxID=299642 RepID=A0A8X6QZR2_NEPPI|nr:hypothetical protein NPIL_290171 [Nephila pilipes]
MYIRRLITKIRDTVYKPLQQSYDGSYNVLPRTNNVYFKIRIKMQRDNIRPIFLLIDKLQPIVPETTIQNRPPYMICSSGNARFQLNPSS